MIGHIRGKVLVAEVGLWLIEVGGIGYEVSVPTGLSALVGEEVSVFVHHAVRDDGQFLYGFPDKIQRDIFRELIRTSGVGAKTALLILSGLSVEEFLRVIEAQDAARLIRIPSIGKKTAERLLLELRDRFAKKFALSACSESTLSERSSVLNEAEAALLALGFKTTEVEKLLAQSIKEAPDCEQDLDALIRMALKLSFAHKAR